jgi:arginine/serine-rich splicing factor 7
MPNTGVKIYVGNLPERARPEEIKECFSKFGNVVNMELKGNYGFIEYEERRICEEAIDSLHGSEFQGSNLRVEFAHGERSGGNFKYAHHHHHHHSNHHHHHNNGSSNNNNNRGETKSTDTCFKCGLVGHWARECTR